MNNFRCGKFIKLSKIAKSVLSFKLVATELKMTEWKTV